MLDAHNLKCSYMYSMVNPEVHKPINMSKQTKSYIKVNLSFSFPFSFRFIEYLIEQLVLYSDAIYTENCENPRGPALQIWGLNPKASATTQTVISDDGHFYL